MRYFKYLLLVLFTTLGFITLLSGISHSDSVSGSKHDLSILGGSGFSFETFQVCVFCHTPHGSNTSIRSNTLIEANDINPSAAYKNTGEAGSGPPILLWNRSLSNAADPSIQVGYERYQSSTLNADNTRIRVYSLLCLSCHDGVGALNVLTKFPGDGTLISTGGGWALAPFGISGDKIGDSNYSASLNPNIGNRLTSDNSSYTGDNAVQLFNDHPISFDYDVTLLAADTGLKSKDSAKAQGIRFFTNPSGVPDISLECSSCHNPHDQGGDESSSQFPFLVMSNDGSALCLACHNK